MEIDERDFGKEERNLTIFYGIEASGTHGSEAKFFKNLMKFNSLNEVFNFDEEDTFNGLQHVNKV